MFGSLKCCHSRIYSSIFFKVANRRYMTVSDTVETMLKRADSVPKHYELIYREKSYRGAGLMFHGMNFFSTVTLVTIGYMWYNGDQLMNPDAETPVFTKKWQQPVIVVSLILGNLLAFSMRKRYPMRIYYSETDKMYKSILIGRIPFTIEQFDFPEKSLSYVAKDSILFWKSALFRCDNGRKILLFDEKFKTPNDFHNMLKPLELQL